MVDYEWYLSEEAIKKGIENGISETTIRTRFYYLNWTVTDAITRPVRKRKHFITDETRKLLKENGITYETYYARLKRGWNVEDASTKPLIPSTGKQFKKKKRTSSKFTDEQIAKAEKKCRSHEITHRDHAGKEV